MYSTDTSDSNPNPVDGNSFFWVWSRWSNFRFRDWCRDDGSCFFTNKRDTNAFDAKTSNRCLGPPCESGLYDLVAFIKETHFYHQL